MTRIRETYDLPQRTPVTYRQWGLMLLVPLLAIVLWVVLPDSPVVVALLAIVVLATVFLGVWRILSSRQLSEPPGRDPVPPPSES
jgi:hypothetical protein